MRTYFEICPECGAHLDPGERCDCADMSAADRAALRRFCCSSAAYQKGVDVKSNENGNQRRAAYPG